MKVHRTLRFLPVVCSLSLLSCGGPPGDVLRVTSPLPANVVARDAVLTFEFSRGVVPVDSVNRWTAAAFVEFAPGIPGKCVWQDTTRLIFSPDQPLPGDARFTGRLNTSLLTKMAGAASFEGPGEFTFGTERFTLRQAELFYDRIGSGREIGIRANLQFSYEVEPADVQRTISVKVDDEEQKAIRVVSPSRAKVIAVELGVTVRREQQRTVTMAFDESLTSPETGTRLYLEHPLTSVLAPLAELEVYGHETGFDGTSGWILVRTSQEVDPATVSPFIVLEPARGLSVESAPGGFILRGALEPGTGFQLRVKKGLTSVLGGATRNDYETPIVIGDVAPSFRFASPSGVYMLLGGAKTIDVTTVNLPRMTVRISQIFRNNLVFFLDGGRYYDYSYGDWWDDETPVSHRKYRYYVGNYGRQLRYDTLAVRGERNRESTTTIDLGPYLTGGYRGFYVVEIADPAEAWRTTSKLVSVSDLGLIVKRGGEEVAVFVVSLLTTKPVAGALVSLISTTNQVMGAERTDEQGKVRFDRPVSRGDDFTLKLVTAEMEDDFNFINLDDYRVETSRFDVAGRRSGGTYDVFLYGDREIYRPGEAIRLSGIVRELGSTLPDRLPVRLRIFNPQGTMVAEQQLTLNSHGSFETVFPTRETALTGEYRCEVTTATGTFLAASRVSVEDFVPDRLRLNFEVSSDTARPGEKVRYALQAFNFFGPPAAGRPWEFEASFDLVPYVSKRFPDFRFVDDAAPVSTGNPDVFTGQTDDEGRATIVYDLPKTLNATGLVRARGRIAVFDESGRPVYRLAQTIVSPRDHFIGVRTPAATTISPNFPYPISIIAVDRHDRPLGGFRARVEVVRREWFSVLRQHPGTGTLRYVSERRDVPVSSEVITLGSQPVEYTVSVRRSGDYAVRVSREGSAGYNQATFYAYSWGTADVTSFPVDPEARVDIVTDRPVYRPGETANLLFTTPFSGTMLVTIERDGLFSHRFLDVRDNAASMDLKVEEGFLPNVYVSAVLFRRIIDQHIPLLAGHGFAPVMVEKKGNRLDVAVRAPAKVRPKTRQTITVSVAGEREVAVTLAAVDEGILQLKNTRTPDPYGFFYAKKALETETYDFFRDLLPEPVAGADRSSAGGGEAEMGLRVTPLGVRRFKPVALWSGIVTTGRDGTVDIPCEIPDFSGELRLMAVAYKGERFGSAASAMTVTDPVVITPALPRFLSPGDSVSMTITAFNTTERAVSLRLAVNTQGGLAPAGAVPTLEAGPNQERAVQVPLRAGAGIGKATVTVKTTAFGESIESVTELPVRPTAPFAAETFAGYVDGGGSATHEVPETYLSYGRRAYITLSPYPVAGLAERLKDLVGYPHGCVEQTVSKAFPQIYLREMASMLAPQILNTGSPAYFVNEAIAKLATMQTFDGAFLFWPGGSETFPWTTVYATHFLVEARKAGYGVPDGMMKSALSATASVARGRATADLTVSSGNRVTVRRIADKACVYALYVLALAGAPEKPTMEFYRADRRLLTRDTQTLLAGAYSLSGDRITFSELLPPAFGPAEGSSDLFDSPVRSSAVILNVLLEADLNSPEIPRLMEELSRIYAADRWFSTQDDAFTLLAFGKAARMAAAARVEGTVTVGATGIPYPGGTRRLDVDPFGKRVTISMRGEGRVYYALVAEGIRTDGAVRIEDRNLQVRREVLDRNGAVVDPGSLRQNDLCVVRITLSSAAERLEHVAVTDLLPAGWEIENPRITEATGYPFTRNATRPTFLDVRDDRINFYTSFARGKRQQVFYYVVRAVTPGHFHHAPIVAEAMYDGRYYSASGGGIVRVTR